MQRKDEAKRYQIRYRSSKGQHTNISYDPWFPVRTESRRPICWIEEEEPKRHAGFKQAAQIACCCAIPSDSEETPLCKRPPASAL